MMTQAFYTGISGLKTNQSAIDVTANNLANVDTIGFREYNTEFSSMFESMLNTSGGNSSVSSSVGLGVQLQSTSTNLDIGAQLNTDRNTDLSISGDGWFGIQAEGEALYTRAGNFTFDTNNDLVTTDGYHVLGTMGGNINGETLTSSIDEVQLGSVNTQESLNFPKTLSYPPEPTTSATFSLNLGVDDEQKSISTNVVDSEGNRNELKLTFTKSQTQVPPDTQWDVQATTQSLDGETIYGTSSGALNFDAYGQLTSNTLLSADNNGTAIDINLGDGYDGIVATDGKNTYASSSSNGTIGGDLLGYEINENAEVIATFSNGMQSSVGKVAVYHFANDQGLARVDGSKFAQSSNSGNPIFFKDANGENILGTGVRNYALESSNVSTEAGLTELIIFQRAYDANSKSITTADEMMKKALNMDA